MPRWGCARTAGARSGTASTGEPCRPLGRCLVGQLEIDLFERGTADGEPAYALAARQRLAGQAVQQLGWVLRLDLHAAAVVVVADAVRVAARAQRGGRS